MFDAYRVRRTSLSVALALCCVLAWPAAAQDDQEFVPGEDEAATTTSTEEAVTTQDGGAAADTGGVVDDGQFVPEDEGLSETFGGDELQFGNVDDLLAADEEVLSDPGIYTYDPGARRDPFRSLLRRRKGPVDPRGPRPKGLPGLLIDELRLQGIFMLPEGPVAQVMSGREDTSFLIRPGDELWDGDVVRITLDQVIFKQSVNDPSALRPFREVVKKLNPARKQ